MTNKVIGIHKGSIGNKYNIGTFLKLPLNQLMYKEKVSNNIYNVNIVPCK